MTQLSCLLQVFFYHAETAVSQYEHPNDALFVRLLEKERAKLQQQQQQPTATATATTQPQKSPVEDAENDSLLLGDAKKGTIDERRDCGGGGSGSGSTVEEDQFLQFLQPRLEAEEKLRHQLNAPLDECARDDQQIDTEFAAGREQVMPAREAKAAHQHTYTAAVARDPEHGLGVQLDQDAAANPFIDELVDKPDGCVVCSFSASLARSSV